MVYSLVQWMPDNEVAGAGSDGDKDKLATKMRITQIYSLKTYNPQWQNRDYQLPNAKELKGFDISRNQTNFFLPYILKRS